MSVEISKKQENHIKKYLDKRSAFQLASEVNLSVYMVRKKIKEFRVQAAKCEAEKAQTVEATNSLQGGFLVDKGTVSMTESSSLQGDENAAKKENKEFFSKHKNSIHRIKRK